MEMSRQQARPAWHTLALVSGIGSVGCGAFSFLLSYLVAVGEPLTPLIASLICTTTAQPLLLLMGLQLFERGQLKRELSRYVSYDGITGCYSGAALPAVVEQIASSKSREQRHGAFLVVYIDHTLRSADFRGGFAWQDETLRAIASAIRISVRSGDVIGRLGPNKFGVFLPLATEADAVAVGERIRMTVAQVLVLPGGNEAALKIRVGGVVFEDELGLEHMFQAAEQQASILSDLSGVRVSKATFNSQAEASGLH